MILDTSAIVAILRDEAEAPLFAKAIERAVHRRLSDNRLGMIGYAQQLLTHGFGVLMPDARAHGASGGDLATYGLLESGRYP